MIFLALHQFVLVLFWISIVLDGTCNFIFILIEHILHVQISYQRIGFQFRRREEILRFQFHPPHLLNQQCAAEEFKGHKFCVNKHEDMPAQEFKGPPIWNCVIFPPKMWSPIKLKTCKYPCVIRRRSPNSSRPWSNCGVSSNRKNVVIAATSKCVVPHHRPIAPHLWNHL